MIATVTGLAGVGTVLLIGGTIYIAFVLAVAQVAHLAGLEQPAVAACDHAHTVYLGDVLVDLNSGNRWVDGWAPVERCVTCGDELVGAPRFTQ